MLSALPLALFLCLQRISCLSDVLDLQADPGFRSVKLAWRARDAPEGDRPVGFVIKYCEDQAWGKYRCRTKEVDINNDDEASGNDIRTYETSVDGLRISTNYTFDIMPKLEGETVPPQQRARALGEHLFIQTKGFYARAINCLANSSLVEIETGPFFGGKISVEGSAYENCSVQGDFTNPQSTYQLNINHTLCGSETNNQSVKSYIIVQENLPILTHSTRRFMVICHYLPETFTVRAGVNLPDEDIMFPVSNDVSEIDASELYDSGRSFFSSRVAKQVGRALKFSSDNSQEDSQKWSHLVLMVVLIVSTIIGICFAIFHFLRRSRKNGAQSDNISSVENSEFSEEGSREVEDVSSICSSRASAVPELDAYSLSDGELSFPASDMPLGSKLSTVTAFSTATGAEPQLTNAFAIIRNIGENDACDISNPIYSNVNANVHCPESFGVPSLIPGNHGQAVRIDNLENIDAVFEEALNIFPSDNLGISDSECLVQAKDT